MSYFSFEEIKAENASSDITDFELQFAATFNQAAVGMAHVGVDGSFIRLNRKFCDITGYSGTELIKLQFQDITHPDDLQLDMDCVGKLLAKELQHYSIEKRYLTKTGGVTWVNLTVSLVWKNADVPLFFIAVIEDIGKRKSAENAINLAQQELEERILNRTYELEQTAARLQHEIQERQIVEAERNRFFTISHDAMIVFDQQGRFQRLNPAAAEILGYSEDELRSIDVNELIHPDDRLRTQQLSAELQKSHYFANFENRYIRKDSTIVDLSWTGALFEEHSLVYCIARDITEIKRQQRVLQEERVKAVAASKIYALGRMASGMSHEVNNPLTVIYGRSQQLRDHLDSGNLDRELVLKTNDAVLKMSERIVAIIQGLSTFSRDGSKDPFDFVTIQSVIDETLSFSSFKMALDCVKLDQPKERVTTEIHCRPVQISQVLLNLLNNARDAVEPNALKLVSIAVVESESEVGIQVEDNGAGLTAEAKEKLFEPFFTTKAIGRGTGLGLSVSKSILDEHAGRLVHEDIAPHGSRFTLWLPRVS